MPTRTASRSQPRLIDTARHTASSQGQAVAADEHSEMFTLMLAELDSRLDAIERRTDRIAAHAA